MFNPLPVILFLAITLSVHAQTESLDTLSLSKDYPQTTVTIQEDATKGHKVTYDYTPTYSPNKSALTNNTDLKVSLPPIIPGVSSIINGENIGIYATGNVVTYPGLMNINSGSINIYQQLGRLKLSAYAEAAKYGYYRGLSTTYGYGGSLTYNINEHFDITAFGSYTTTPGYFTPSMAGYINTTNYGAYINYRINDKWGVKTGVQRYQSIMNNSWQTQPMVIPYFRLGNGQEIGIDIGSILYNIIGNTRADYNRGNPTIAPPIMKGMH